MNQISPSTLVGKPIIEIVEVRFQNYEGSISRDHRVAYWGKIAARLMEVIKLAIAIDNLNSAAQRMKQNWVYREHDGDEQYDPQEDLDDQDKMQALQITLANLSMNTNLTQLKEMRIQAEDQHAKASRKHAVQVDKGFQEWAMEATKGLARQAHLWTTVDDRPVGPTRR